MKFTIQKKILAALVAVGIPVLFITVYILVHFLGFVEKKEIHDQLQSSRTAYLRFQEQQHELLITKAKAIAQIPYLKATLGIPGVDHETLFYLNSQLRAIADMPLMLILDADYIVKVDLNNKQSYGGILSELPGVSESASGNVYQGLWLYDEIHYSVVIVPIIIHDELLGLFVLGDRIDSPEAQKTIFEITGATPLFLLQKAAFTGNNSISPHEIDSLIQRVFDKKAGFVDPTSLMVDAVVSNDRYHSITIPLQHNAGFLVLSKAAGKFDTGIETMRKTLVIVAVVTVLLGTLFGIWIASKISRPIRTLTEAAKQYGKGDLSGQIDLKSRDEIGDLASAFNRMIQDLEVTMSERELAIEELEQLTDTLERRVLDRTEKLEAVNSELQHLALYDQLTGLPNRTLANDRLNQAIRHSHRTGEAFSVVMMDLDGFKQVNDGLGHAAGDRLLTKVADRLQPLIDGEDTIARLGGDEFVVILQNTDCKRATSIASELLAAFDARFILGENSVSVSTSLGIAVYPEHGNDQSELLRHADVAMYAAKRSKCGIQVYNPTQDPHSRRRLALIADLRLALERKELEVHFQPIIALKTGCIRGVEALARWNHPRKGFVPPDQFIDIAEETGLIRPLTQWVLETTLQQAADWRAVGLDIPVAVNLSMLDLGEPQLAEHLSFLLARYQIPGKALTLELTESAMMESAERANTFMTDCQSVGIRFAIDDFGTGYSSLSYLKKLPLQSVKIDRSFIKDLVSDKGDYAIVRSIIDLAHNLGMSVIAEGVEDAAACTMLLKHGCEYAQGYYYCPPLPAQELTEAIHSSDAGLRLRPTKCIETEC